MATMRSDARFTVDDYRSLPERFPAELIDGGFVKEPAPTWRHQQVVLALAARLLATLDRHRVLLAPADLVIDRWNVLQPDLAVFGEGVDVRVATGAVPRLVVEVLSPGTAERDRGVKCDAYLRLGVEEVWLVDPDAQTIDVRTRDRTVTSAGDAQAASHAVPGLCVSARELLA